MSNTDKKDKKKDENTEAWIKKQEEKKRKKELMQAQGEQTEKADKKEKKEKKKAQKKQEEPDKKEQLLQDKKAIQAKFAQKKSNTEPETKASVPSYRNMIKIDELIPQKDRQSRVYQQELINSFIEKFITSKDVLLYLGSKDRIRTSQQVYVKDFNSCCQAELVCRYSDLSYFLEGSVTKIFIEAEYIFANGSILAKSGALNVALMGSYYNIPVVAVGGSWLYCGCWGPVNEEALEERYGGQQLKGLDWIEKRFIKSTILEVGAINPGQVSIYPPLIYKQLSLQSVEW